MKHLNHRITASTLAVLVAITLCACNTGHGHYHASCGQNNAGEELLGQLVVFAAVGVIVVVEAIGEAIWRGLTHR